MTKPTFRKSLLSVALLVALMAACSPSANATESTDAVSTQVEQTAPTQPGTATDIPVANAASTEETPIANSATAQPIGPCNDAAAFVADVTIPDGTVMSPGQPFAKTWRLQNTGTCTWTTDYTVVLEEGPANAVWTDSPHPLPTSVAPGQYVEVTANLTAPVVAGGSNYNAEGSSGEYTAYYQLKNPEGVGLLNFTAAIKVQEESSVDFAVTNIFYEVSTWSDTVNGVQYANCPLITATITVNGAGIVGFRWMVFFSQNPSAFTILSGEGYSGSLTFDAAGTQSVSQRWTYRESSGGRGMMFVGDSGGMYIESPNHLSFGGVFLPVCTSP